MESEEKKQVSIRGVVELLESGKTRPEIKAELGLTHAQMKDLFSHPKLKGRRTHTSKNSFEIIDDLEEDDTADAAVDTPATEEQPTDELQTVEETPVAPSPEEVKEEPVAPEPTAAPTPEVAQVEEEKTEPEPVVEENPTREETVQPMRSFDDWSTPVGQPAEPEVFHAEEVAEDRAPFDRT